MHAAGSCLWICPCPLALRNIERIKSAAPDAFSPKVFLGGVPFDVTERTLAGLATCLLPTRPACHSSFTPLAAFCSCCADELQRTFQAFGPLSVEWPSTRDSELGLPPHARRTGAGGVTGHVSAPEQPDWDPICSLQLEKGAENDSKRMVLMH